MKTIFMYFLILLSFENYCQEWGWTKIYLSDTTNSNAWASVNASVVDIQDNIYAVGEFGGGIIIDTIYYLSNSSIQLFIVKNFENGDVQWSKIVGGTGEIYVTGIVCDDSGYCYITGSFAGTINFDTIQVTSSWGKDPYIAKLDPEGKFIWVSFGRGTTADDISQSITISKQGFLYITGYFYGNMLFGNQWINGGSYTNIFIVKCDRQGNFLWARNAGATNYDDYGYSIADDDSGNVYATGSFEGSGHFGSFILQGYGYSDIYVTKINSSGDFIWAKHFGSTSVDWGFGISVSNQGDVGLTGFINSGTNGVYFDNFTIYSNGADDAFIAKLNSNNGNVEWVKNIGGPSDDVGRGVVFDYNSDICFIGNFQTSISFPDTIIVSYGTNDFFVCKYDKYGNFIWVNRYGTTGYERVRNISIDQFNNLYISAGINGAYSPVVSTVKDGFLGKMYDELLPVELTSFSDEFLNKKIHLQWSTSTELNNHGFEIERSTNKSDWRIVAFKDGKGTTTEPQQYYYSDDISDITSSKFYYRLKQIDFNGSYEYSEVVEVEIISLTFSLEQNYPNPFNPSTKISWQSPVGSWQTLKVYDILGNEVATLVNEYRNAGSYEVEFKSTVGSLQLANGVYFYRLQVGDFVETKKMILLK